MWPIWPMVNIDHWTGNRPRSKERICQSQFAEESISLHLYFGASTPDAPVSLAARKTG